ncbi:hypothetical protein CWI36_2018p0010 [Hamiltosporidium magnivora]|uniref:Uncharacterized protein n=1 Tax=Hamiltosporidium magnivora TaxID=148818 RepID=A0A4Q9KXG5_9MICR|nr:hypothetical protein CWI36_2018p0010 [Hamiltosporidium magnivora]
MFHAGLNRSSTSEIAYTYVFKQQKRSERQSKKILFKTRYYYNSKLLYMLLSMFKRLADIKAEEEFKRSERKRIIIIFAFLTIFFDI